MTPLTQLSAISPIDGRYGNSTNILSAYFSEAALFKYRVKVEIEYFIALCELPLPQLKEFDKDLFGKLRNIYLNFTELDAQQIKNIEKSTNHDVKAVEYFIKEKFEGLNINLQKEFIHFGLTSQDINNTAIPWAIKDAMNECILPLLNNVLLKLSYFANEWSSVPMLARTHGQPASPTRLGKEIQVFVVRLENQIAQLNLVAQQVI